MSVRHNKLDKIINQSQKKNPILREPLDQGLSQAKISFLITRNLLLRKTCPDVQISFSPFVSRTLWRSMGPRHVATSYPCRCRSATLSSQFIKSHQPTVRSTISFKPGEARSHHLLRSHVTIFLLSSGWQVLS